MIPVTSHPADVAAYLHSMSNTIYLANLVQPNQATYLPLSSHAADRFRWASSYFQQSYSVFPTDSTIFLRQKSKYYAFDLLNPIPEFYMPLKLGRNFVWQKTASNTFQATTVKMPQ
jgi:hypothetical protein